VSSLNILVHNKARAVQSSTLRQFRHRVTSRSKRLKNVETTASRGQFERKLMDRGWTMRDVGGGAREFTRGGSKYNTYPRSGSTRGPSAKYYPRGSGKPTISIRFNMSW